MNNPHKSFFVSCLLQTTVHNTCICILKRSVTATNVSITVSYMNNICMFYVTLSRSSVAGMFKAACWEELAGSGGQLCCQPALLLLHTHTHTPCVKFPEVIGLRDESEAWMAP